MTTDDIDLGATYFRLIGPTDAGDLIGLLDLLDPGFVRAHGLTASAARAIAADPGGAAPGMLMAGTRPVAYGWVEPGIDGRAGVVHVAVDRASRRQGVGGRLMEHLHEQARASGARTLRAHLDTSDPGATGFFAAMGYREGLAESGAGIGLAADLGAEATGRPLRLGRAGRYRSIGKRLFDLIGAATALVVFSPVIAWVSVALLVTQGRPILFRHSRPGWHGRPFTMVKFRTMRSARPGEVWYLTDQARVTRLGRFLRATSIDELPELWNVLRGDMSLVGPRPLLIEYLDTYTADEARRHDVRPGVTSWAAVNGRHTLRFRERLQLDVWYVDHWSLGLDLRIVWQTIGQVVRRSDVATTQDMASVGFPLRADGIGPDGRDAGGPDARA